MSLVLYEGKQYINTSSTIPADVPENPLAKLMYYLNCVVTLISYSISSKLTDFHNYFNLERNEINDVLKYISALSPDLFINKKIIVKNKDLCISGSNEFFKISNSNTNPIEFHIGGKKFQTFSMMACTEKWLDDNYYTPKKAYSDQIFNIIFDSSNQL